MANSKVSPSVRGRGLKPICNSIISAKMEVTDG